QADLEAGLGALLLNSTQTEMVLRRLEGRDLPAALRFTQELNWSHRLEDWEFHARLGRGWAACEPPDDLVGTAIWWPWGPDVGTVGFVLVRKDRQGRGIGARLMDVVLEDAGPRTLRLVATRAGLGIYRRLGFVERGAILQCQGELARVPAAAPPPGVALSDVTEADVDSLCELDAGAFGAPRPELIRAIYALGGGGLVATRDGAPVGFVLQRFSGRGMLLGPLVAEDEPLAIALASALLARGTGFTRADIPADAQALAAHLGTFDMRAVDEYASMTRGELPARRASVRTFGLVSQALG
ncbi:MAG: GNAT family N-acetyltransferase, partial [Gammaproteobacteria bacterium]